MKKFLHGFAFAFNGLRYALRTQLNFRVHLVLAAVVIVLGILLKISITEWCFIIFCIAMVLVVELLNTALEILTDLVSPGFNEKAGRLKDVSAGAVLVAAFFALVVGIIIFLPKLLALLPHAA